MDDNRPFPIQRDGNNPASTIPWWLAEIAYAFYAQQYGHAQSLERLAERGGFGRAELVGLLQRIENPWDEKVCLCPSDGIYGLCPVHGGRAQR